MDKVLGGGRAGDIWKISNDRKIASRIPTEQVTIWWQSGVKTEARAVIKERDKYKFELESERFWNKRKEEERWSIFESELDKANKDLGHRAGQYTKRMIDPKSLK